MRLPLSSLPVLALDIYIWMCIKRRAEVKEGFGRPFLFDKEKIFFRTQRDGGGGGQQLVGILVARRGPCLDQKLSPGLAETYGSISFSG